MSVDQRDLLSRLEFLPQKGEGPKFLRGLTNRTILALKELYKGQFADSRVPQFRWGDPKIWERSSPLVHSFVKGVLKSWRSLRLDSTHVGNGSQCLRDLLGLEAHLDFEPFSFSAQIGHSPSLCYSCHRPLFICPNGDLACVACLSTAPKECDSGLQRPRKGTVTPLVVSNVSLPKEGSQPVPLTDFVPAARHYFSDISRFMLRDETEGRELREGMKGYSDPVLRNRKTKLALIGRLWKSGMLVETREVFRNIEVFTVVKKLEDQADGSVLVHGRLIFDGRVPNTDWRDPPWVGLSGPGCMAGLDLGAVEEAGLKARLATGDVPDWFYKLGIPRALAGYFGWEGVSTKELAELLRGEGWTGPLPDEEMGKCLGMGVLVMGWSWAVYLAQSALEAIVVGLAPDFRRERQLVQGAPIPQFLVEDASTHVAFWLYVDDFGILSMEKGQGTGRAEHLRGLVRERLEGLGFGCHKEEGGTSAPSVGVLVGGRPARVSPLPERLSLLIGATDFLTQQPLINIAWLECILGMWSWSFLINRPLLATFSAVYPFVRTHRGCIVQWDESARKEMCATVALSVFMVSELTRPWHPGVYMTDASPTGGALVETTDTTLGEIRKESLHASQGGWQVFISPEEGIWEEEREESLKRIPREVFGEKKFMRVLLLCSGKRRVGDMTWHFQKFHWEKGVRTEVDLVDLEVDPPVDLLDLRIYRKIAAKARTGWWAACHASPHCATWSAALLVPVKGGPLPYRDREHPWGLPGLSGRRLHRCQEGSNLLLMCLSILQSVVLGGGSVTLEHPSDKGKAPYASIWATSAVAEFLQTVSGEIFLVDQCCW